MTFVEFITDLAEKARCRKPPGMSSGSQTAPWYREKAGEQRQLAARGFLPSSVTFATSC